MLITIWKLKMGSPCSFLRYKHLKLKLMLFLRGCIAAMVTYFASESTATCSPIIGQFFNTMILASTDIEWLKWPIKVYILEIAGNRLNSFSLSIKVRPGVPYDRKWVSSAYEWNHLIFAWKYGRQDSLWERGSR